MNYLVAQANLSDRIHCDSAGTSSYHIGAAPDTRMRAAAESQGIVLTGRSRQVSLADFETFDLLLAMDRDNYQSLLRLEHTGQYHPKVRLMCDFCKTFPDTEVPDPYYGGSDGFRYVVDLLQDACGGLLKHLAVTHALPLT